MTTHRGLKEAVARHMEVDQQEGAVLMVEAEGLVDAEEGVERQGADEVMGMKGGMANIGAQQEGGSVSRCRM
jgi:hypothetical protein